MQETYHHNHAPHTPIAVRLRQAQAAQATPSTEGGELTNASQVPRHELQATSPSLSALDPNQDVTSPAAVHVHLDEPLKPWPGTRPAHQEPEAPDTANGWGDWPLWASWRPTNPTRLAEVEAAGLAKLRKPYKREFVQINAEGHAINTLRMGSGPPLLLVHGMGGGIVFWAANLDHLAEHFTVYAIDFLGWGRSSRPPVDKNVKTDARSALDWGVEHLEAWRKAVGIEKMVLAGHSMGGYYAMEYALKYHDRLSNLILMDPWGVPRHEDVEWKQPLIVRKILPVLAKAPLLTVVRALGPFAPTLIGVFRSDYRKHFTPVLGDNNTARDYIYHCAAQHPTGEIVFQALCTERYFAKVAMSNRVRHELPEAAKPVPISFLYGKNTWMNPEIGYKEAMALKERGFDVRVFGIEDAGHHLYVEQFQEFNEALTAIATHNWDHADKFSWVPPEKPKEHSLNPFGRD